MPNTQDPPPSDVIQLPPFVITVKKRQNDGGGGVGGNWEWEYTYRTFLFQWNAAMGTFLEIPGSGEETTEVRPVGDPIPPVPPPPPDPWWELVQTSPTIVVNGNMVSQALYRNTNTGQQWTEWNYVGPGGEIYRNVGGGWKLFEGGSWHDVDRPPIFRPNSSGGGAGQFQDR